MTAAETPLDEIVDTDRYPLTRRAEVVAKVRRDLHEQGCSVLPDFIRPDRHELLREQGASLAEQAYYQLETVNAYNTAPDPALPDDHPAHLTMQRGNAFVARDRIPGEFDIHRLYRAEAFRGFVADCFGLPEVFELADPFSGLCVNVIPVGRAHPWHFDTNEFTVSLLTSAAEPGGGEFEYCPNIRSATEENLADVREVLHGRGEHLVRGLSLRPGDLQLFTGRYSLHRVSTVTGTAARHSAIFAYSERPGVVGTPVRTRQLFGRVAPEHLAAQHTERVDRLLI